MRMTFLDPGMLRTELTLLRPLRTEDGMGGAAETWETVASVFALMEPVGAPQALIAVQDIESVTHRITLRHRAGLESGMRFARGTRRFRIITIRDPDETGRYLTCLTEELP
jgi:SPP1 family predicted phage head-tail adaptor